MELFLKVYFWLGALGILGRLFLLSQGEYPRIKTISAGEDFAGALLAIGFVVWAGMLLWWGN